MDIYLLYFFIIIIKMFSRFGSKTEEPEASRLEDTQRPPIQSWEAGGLFRPRLDPWLLRFSPPPTCLGRSRSTAARTCHRCTPTGSRSTATPCLLRHLPQLCTSRPNWGPQSFQSRVSGRMSRCRGSSSLRGSTWPPRCPVSSLVRSLRPAAGSPTTPPPAAPSRASETSKLHRGLIRLFTAPPQPVGVTPPWTRWSPPTLSRCTGRSLRVKDTPTHRWAHRPPWATSQTWSTTLPL